MAIGPSHKILTYRLRAGCEGRPRRGRRPIGQNRHRARLPGPCPGDSRGQQLLSFRHSQDPVGGKTQTLAWDAPFGVSSIVLCARR